jgi:hypothetical protein
MNFLEQSVQKQKTNKMFLVSSLVCLYACTYCWLVIATTDDVSLATNWTFLPFIGTKMHADLVYLVLPLVMISIYGWFLFHLRRLVLILSSRKKSTTGGGSLVAWLEDVFFRVLAWITMPAAFIGLWMHYLLRRDWTVTGFHIFFITLAIFMVVFFHLSSRPREAGKIPVRRQIKISGVIFIGLLALTLWILSLGVFIGTPKRHLERYGDLHGLVPWLFHQVGYTVFFNFDEEYVSKLPENYYLIVSESDRMAAIEGAILSKADLRYADVYQAFVVKANMRNSKLQGAILRESDFRNADLRGANLKGADLRQANFQGADFREAILTGVDLRDADLSNTQLGLADFRKADFRNTKLTGADLRCVDLRGAKRLSLTTLQTVKTLYRAALDREVQEKLEKTNKELFKKPADDWFDMTTPYNVHRKYICEGPQYLHSKKVQEY